MSFFSQTNETASGFRHGYSTGCDNPTGSAVETGGPAMRYRLLGFWMVIALLLAARVAFFDPARDVPGFATAAPASVSASTVVNSPIAAN